MENGKKKWIDNNNNKKEEMLCSGFQLIFFIETMKWF